MGTSHVPVTIRAVALDVDGTLAGADHRVSSRTTRALEALEARGVHPIIVTGRTEHAARTIAEAARLSAPVISCNGALITTVSGERLRTATFDSATIAAAQLFAQKHELRLIRWSPSAMFTERSSELTDLLRAVNDEEPVIAAPAPSEPIVKIMLGAEPERLDTISDALTGTIPLFKRSMPSFFEASPPGSEKSHSLQFVLQSMAIDPSECIGFGDGDTDREWMSEMGEAIAVSNARPSVLAIASETIGHHAEDAVADYLERRFIL